MKSIAILPTGEWCEVGYQNRVVVVVINDEQLEQLNTTYPSSSSMLELASNEADVDKWLKELES